MQPSPSAAQNKKPTRLPTHDRAKIPAHKRKRVAAACDECNIRRVKCSGERPCYNCRSASRQCLYPLSTKKKVVLETKWDELNERLALYERAIGILLPDASRRRELLRRCAARPGTVSQQQADNAESESDSEWVDEGHEATEGRLLQDPDGNPRFLGETSGAVFLDHLKEFLRTVLPLTGHGTQHASGGSGFLASLGQYQTYDSRPLHDRVVDPQWLPSSVDVAGMLREFRHLLQDGNGEWPSGGIYWWADFDLPPQDSDTSAAHAPSHRHRAICNTAFAIVSQASLSRAPQLGQPSYPSEAYFSRAHAFVGNPLDTTHFTTSDVACLALMGFYLVEMNRRDTGWKYIRFAMDISIMHGAHRGWSDEKDRRVFWTVYILECWLSCLLGRPPIMMDAALRVPLPHDVQSMPPAAGLRAHAKLARIASSIVCNTYVISPWVSSKGAMTQLQMALNALDEWRSGLPDSLQLDARGVSRDPACCLLHMHHNQLLLLVTRPIFFGAVKKAYAEQCIAGQTSLKTHPKLAQLRRCVGAAVHTMQLTRQLLELIRPRKLMQAGLHFVFNSAICLMLQELIYVNDGLNADGLTPEGQNRYSAHATYDGDIEFAIARFDEEGAVGNNYGKDCASVLRDIRCLVGKLKAVPIWALSSAREAGYRTVGNEAAFLRGSLLVPNSQATQPLKVVFEQLWQWMHKDDWHLRPDYAN